MHLTPMKISFPFRFNEPSKFFNSAYIQKMINEYLQNENIPFKYLGLDPKTIPFGQHVIFQHLLMVFLLEYVLLSSKSADVCT